MLSEGEAVVLWYIRGSSLAQFVQGENNPNSVWLLQCALGRDGMQAFKPLGPARKSHRESYKV